MAAASVSVTGARRTATSPTSSTAVPPAPQATRGPRAGSAAHAGQHLDAPGADLSLDDEALAGDAPRRRRRRDISARRQQRVVLPVEADLHGAQLGLVDDALARRP